MDNLILDLHEQLIEKEQKINELKKGYCKLMEQCNRGECDCTREEYHTMQESNIKLSVENEELQDRIDKAIDLLKTLDEDTLSNMQLSLEIIGHIEYILKGSDKE